MGKARRSRRGVLTLPDIRCTIDGFSPTCSAILRTLGLPGTIDVLPPVEKFDFNV